MDRVGPPAVGVVALASAYASAGLLPPLLRPFHLDHGMEVASPARDTESSSVMARFGVARDGNG